MKIRPTELEFIQKVFTTSRNQQACTAELVVQATPFIAAGLIERGAAFGSSGAAFLTIPFEVQQQLAVSGYFLKAN